VLRACRRAAVEVKESAPLAIDMYQASHLSGRGSRLAPGRQGEGGRGPCSKGSDLLHRAPLQREAAAPAFASTAVVAELVDALA
jgi:hypothetical protein